MDSYRPALRDTQSQGEQHDGISPAGAPGKVPVPPGACVNEVTGLAPKGKRVTVIGFMLWIWLSVIVILLGGKLNAEIEHQTARDSTEGGGKPLGQRGAKMADTVGAAQD